MSRTTQELPDPADLHAIALHRLEILDAYAIAMDRRTELMAIIADAASDDDALTAVERDFGFTAVQAYAVLDLQLRRFATVQRDRVLAERAELRTRLGLS